MVGNLIMPVEAPLDVVSGITVAPGVVTPLPLRMRLNIPDLVSDTVVFDVADTFTVQSVMVILRGLAHESAGDLQVSLQHSGYSASAFLINGQCSTCNYGDVSPVNESSAGLDYAFSDDGGSPMTESCSAVIPEGLYISPPPRQPPVAARAI